LNESSSLLAKITPVVATLSSPVPSNHQQKSVRMNNSFGSNADQGTGFSAKEHKMLDKMLELLSVMIKDLKEMKKDQAERDAAMKKKLEERDAAMEKKRVSLIEGKFDDLKKELKDKEDEAWRGKHGPP